MARIKFNFENQAPTFTPPSFRRGALTTLSDTKSGLRITISRGRSSFDVVSNIGQQLKSNSFGRRSLDPFIRPNDPTPFTVNFSRGVYRVSIDMGDYGDDNNDRLFLRAFSGRNGSGRALASRTERLPANGFRFTSKTLTLTSRTPIRSIRMIGGSSGFRNSVFYDNLIVDTNPIRNRANEKQSSGLFY